MNIAAFFDLDGTIIGVNSGRLWMLRERRLGRITVGQLLEASVMLLAYRASIIDMEAAIHKALAVYRGEKEDDLERWTREWYRQEIVPRILPGARQAIEEHRRQGHQLVLLTSSSPYLSTAISEELHLDGWISTTYEVQAGQLTGKPHLPLCYGAGKIAHAERYAHQHQVSVEQSFFYTDSFSDLPMLLRVGQPRVVNPDLRLRLYAHWRGWPMIHWS